MNTTETNKAIITEHLDRYFALPMVQGMIKKSSLAAAQELWYERCLNRINNLCEYLKIDLNCDPYLISGSGYLYFTTIKDATFIIIKIDVEEWDKEDIYQFQYNENWVGIDNLIFNENDKVQREYAFKAEDEYTKCTHTFRSSINQVQTQEEVDKFVTAIKQTFFGIKDPL